MCRVLQGGSMWLSLCKHRPLSCTRSRAYASETEAGLHGMQGRSTH